MNITFTAATMRELEQQIRDFLGEPCATERPTSGSTGAQPGRPVPGWAPAGSRWVQAPGAPLLVGPDWKHIHVRWDGDQALPGEPPASLPPDPAGQALLEVLGGR